MERFTVCFQITCRVLTKIFTRDALQVLTRDLEAIMMQLPVQSLAALPSNHDIRHLLRQILYLAKPLTVNAHR